MPDVSARALASDTFAQYDHSAAVIDGKQIILLSKVLHSINV